MKKTLTKVLLLAGLLLIGCISDDAKRAATAAAQAIMAENVKIEKLAAYDTERENYKSYKLVFSNFDKSITEGYKYERVTSLGAYIFVSGLKPADMEKYQKVEVQLNLSGANIHRDVYDIERILRTKEHMEKVSKLFDAIQEKNYSLYEKLTSLSEEDKEGVVAIYNAYMSADSLGGAFERINFTGFTYSTNPEKKTDETTVWCEFIQRNDYITTAFRFSDRTGNLLYTGINVDE